MRLDYAEGEKVLLLVDWGFAGPLSKTPSSKVYGTPYTMSQKVLASFILAKLKDQDDVADIRARFKPIAGDGVYTVQDELESAVKSLLLILSPTLKRCIRRGVVLDRTRRILTTSAAPGAAPYVVLWDCWQELLGDTELLDLCRAESYDGIVKWFEAKKRLLFWQSASFTSPADISASRV